MFLIPAFDASLCAYLFHSMRSPPGKYSTHTPFMAVSEEYPHVRGSSSTSSQVPFRLLS